MVRTAKYPSRDRDKALNRLKQCFVRSLRWVRIIRTPEALVVRRMQAATQRVDTSRAAMVRLRLYKRGIISSQLSQPHTEHLTDMVAPPTRHLRMDSRRCLRISSPPSHTGCQRTKRHNSMHNHRCRLQLLSGGRRVPQMDKRTTTMRRRVKPNGKSQRACKETSACSWGI